MVGFGVLDQAADGLAAAARHVLVGWAGDDAGLREGLSGTASRTVPAAAGPARDQEMNAVEDFLGALRGRPRPGRNHGRGKNGQTCALGGNYHNSFCWFEAVPRRIPLSFESNFRRPSSPVGNRPTHRPGETRYFGKDSAVADFRASPTLGRIVQIGPSNQSIARSWDEETRQLASSLSDFRERQTKPSDDCLLPASSSVPVSGPATISAISPIWGKTQALHPY